MTNIYVFGKLVGKVIDSVFEKQVDSKIHFLRCPPAICIDKRSLDFAEQAGAKYLRIIDKRTDKIFACTIRRARSYGFDIDRGYGKQLAVPIERWAVSDKKQLRLI